MKKTILFSSLFLMACSTTKPEPDLLESHADESFPEQEKLFPKKLDIYLYSHENAMGDHVGGTWIKVEDPR